MNRYEVNGVLRYANCFSIEVEAENPQEAKMKIESRLSELSDPSIAEFQDGIVDEGILLT